MIPVVSSLMTTLLGLAGMFLGLAVLVQVVQEVYKYLTDSKSRAYVIALKDFLGPWAGHVVRAGSFPDMRVRGPFQWKRLRPAGRLLPLGKEELIRELEQTAPPWVYRTLDALKHEEKLQGSGRQVSPVWRKFLGELGRTEVDTPGYWSAAAVAEFLSRYGHRVIPPKRGGGKPEAVGKISPPEELDAARLSRAFRQEFLSHVDDVADRFPQLTANFEYAYRRRNIRHTLVIALVIVVLFDLPLDRLIRTSAQLSADEAVELARTAVELYDRQKELHGTADSAMADQLVLALRVSSASLRRADPAGGDTMRSLLNVRLLTVLPQQGLGATGRYLLGCLLTTLLVSFGAPFWNDLASMLLRLQKGVSLPRREEGGGVG
jgi:hypothetical protein